MSGNKEAKPKTSCAGLYREWEHEELIRDHLRSDGAVLFQGEESETVKSVSKPLVACLLKPVLLRMASTEDQPQPAVEPFREQLRDLYRVFNHTVHEPVIFHDAWCLRKALAFVKMKARKRMPSEVPCMSCEVACARVLSVFMDGGILELWHPGLCVLTCNFNPCGLSHAHAQVEAFQELVLILNPMLQDRLCGGGRALALI